MQRHFAIFFWVLFTPCWGSITAQHLQLGDIPLYQLSEDAFTSVMKDICIAWDSLREHPKTANEFPERVTQTLQSVHPNEQTYARLYSAVQAIDQGRVDDAIFHTQYARQLAQTKSLHPNVRLLFHGTYARLLRLLQLDSLALPQYHAALKMLREVEYQPVHHWLFIYSHMAACHSRLKNMDSVLVYRKKAVAVALQRNDKRRTASGYNNIGILFQAVNRDSAHFYFHKALRTLMPSDLEDSIFLQSINDNLGLLFFNDEQFDSARWYFEKNAILAHLLNDTVRLIQTNMEIVAISLREYKLSEARRQLAAIKEMFTLSKHTRKPHLEKRLWKLFQELSTLSGNHQLALDYANKAQAIEDSLVSKESHSLRTGIAKLNELKIETARKEMLLLLERERSALQKAKNQRMLSVAAIAFAIMVSAFVVLRFRWRRQRLEKENQLLETREQLALSEVEKKELEEIRLKQSLELKHKDIANMALNLAEKDQFTAEVVAKLEQVTTPAKKPIRPKLEKLCRELNNSRQVSEKSLALQTNIAEVNREFYKKLGDTFPTLSKSEVELCALFKIGLDSKEISVIKNITMPSLRTMRHRIRRKMDVTAEQDLHQFLQDF